MVLPHQPFWVCIYLFIKKTPAVPLALGLWTKVFLPVCPSCFFSSNSPSKYQIKGHFLKLITFSFPDQLVASVPPPSYYSSSKYLLSLASLRAWEIQQWRQQTQILVLLTLELLVYSLCSLLDTARRGQRTYLSCLSFSFPAHSTEPGKL